MKIASLIKTLAAAWLLAGCVTLGGIKQAEQPFKNDEDFRTWFAFYYQDPHPEKLTAALKFMRANGYLDEEANETRDMPIIASVFLSRVFAANQGQLAGWTEGWQKMDQQEWYVILIGLLMSDNPTAKALVQANLHKVDSDHQNRIHSMGEQNLQTLDPLTAEVVSGRQINLLWSAFSATGDSRYVEKVITNVHFYGDRQNERRMIGEAALMSLANNAMQHDVVNRLCVEANAKATDPKTRVLLSAMLSAIAEVARDHAEESISH